MSKDNDRVGTWQFWRREGINTFRHAANIENTNYVGAVIMPSTPAGHPFQERVKWLGDNHRPPDFGDKLVDPTGKAFELHAADGPPALRETEHPAPRAALAETEPAPAQTAGNLRRSSLLPPPGWAAERASQQRENEPGRDNGQDQGMSL
jgi:hypothetical protein